MKAMQCFLVSFGERRDGLVIRAEKKRDACKVGMKVFNAPYAGLELEKKRAVVFLVFLKGSASVCYDGFRPVWTYL